MDGAGIAPLPRCPGPPPVNQPGTGWAPCAIEARQVSVRCRFGGTGNETPGRCLETLGYVEQSLPGDLDCGVALSDIDALADG